jgi:hypothetical protein
VQALASSNLASSATLIRKNVNTVITGPNRLVSILVQTLAAIWALTSTNAGLIDPRDIQVG